MANRALWMALTIGMAVSLGGCQTTGSTNSADITGSVNKPASSSEIDRDANGVRDWYQSIGSSMAYNTNLPYCHGFGCTRRVSVPMAGGPRAALNAIMAGASASADAERAAVEKAVAWFEHQAIPLMGGVIDRNGTDPVDNLKVGQTDCVDEAANTTTFLKFLAREGLLKHHSVARPVARGGLTVPHVTAVLRERSTNTLYAVDSWVADGGQPPAVMTLARWDEWMATGH
jgi:hypothetical protein